MSPQYLAVPCIFFLLVGLSSIDDSFITRKLELRGLVTLGKFLILHILYIIFMLDILR